jgi:microcin C transport system permease protein
MIAYIFKRLILIIPTLLGVMVLNFVITQAAPGGPVDRMIYQLTVQDGGSATSNFTGSGQGDAGSSKGGMIPLVQSYEGKTRSSRGLDPEMIAQIEKMYGFDKPPLERFMHMMQGYMRADFGESFFRDARVMDIIIEKLPVSISLGLWTTLLTYLCCIPLGIKKAVRDGSPFDIATSWAILIGYSIPSFLFAIVLLIVFAGGEYVQWFPLQGISSDLPEGTSLWIRIKDYMWHMTLPIVAMMIGSFASLSMLTKNSFLDEIGKHYVMTARAKGLRERHVLMRHVFRNAMLIVIAGFPQALIKILFTSSLLIEVIFSLDGLGLLGFEAVVNRDYPIVFGTLFIFTLLGLVMNLIGDIIYMLVDPRIDFERRSV